MQTRTALFCLAVALYLACDVASELVYSSHQSVRVGQNWTIVCSGFESDDEIDWQRNDQSIEKEFSSGKLNVFTDHVEHKSTLIGQNATEFHEGIYKCIPSSPQYAQLSVDVGYTVKILKKYRNQTVTLECKTEGQPANWTKDGLLIKNSPAIAQMRIENGTNYENLTLKYDNDTIFGDYRCDGKPPIEYRVVPKPIINLPQSLSIVEGEKLRLPCTADLRPGAKVSWLFSGTTYNSSRDRVTLARDNDKNVNNAILVVAKIEKEDRGDIKCLVSYNTTMVPFEGKTFLRVKDKLAALWPFLGICAEVAVLCAVILVYEKKRNKAELEESDTDQSPDTKPTQNKDSEVRQRK